LAAGWLAEELAGSRSTGKLPDTGSMSSYWGRWTQRWMPGRWRLDGPASGGRLHRDCVRTADATQA
jgi:hypothetical protein